MGCRSPPANRARLVERRSARSRADRGITRFQSLASPACRPGDPSAIGIAYGFSVFWLPLWCALGIQRSVALPHLPLFGARFSRPVATGPSLISAGCIPVLAVWSSRVQFPALRPIISYLGRGHAVASVAPSIRKSVRGRAKAQLGPPNRRPVQGVPHCAPNRSTVAMPAVCPRARCAQAPSRAGGSGNCMGRQPGWPGSGTGPAVSHR